MTPARLLALALTVTLPVAGAAVPAPAPVPADAKDDAKAELAKLAGTWKVVSYKKAGVELLKDKEGAPEILVTFKKDGSFEFANEDDSPGKITHIDPSKKLKEIDYVFSAGAHKGKTQKAIYKLDGDTFSDCFTEPGAEDRPTEFSSTKENKYTIAVYKRVKRKD